MEFLDYNSKGTCSTCGALLGFSKLGSKEYFCYNCENYVKLPIDECIKSTSKELQELRNSFRDLIIKGDVRRYLRSYLNVLETIFVSNSSEIAPTIDIDKKIEILPFNQELFITMNLAIKWILEDLNFKIRSGNDFEMDIASNIMVQWLKIFQQKVFLENDLGIFIRRPGYQEKKFYYYQYLDFYQDSLDDYSTFNKGELTVENYDKKLTEFFEKCRNPENIFELVKFDFPLTYICSLYNLYPNKEDRMFSFTDIIVDFSVPLILQKLINIYDAKRSSNLDDLNLPGKNFFVITDHAQLKQDFRDIPWSLEIFNQILVSSKKNPMSFPLLIEFGNEIYVSPTRLKVALRLIKQKIIHTHESDFLSKKFEIEFQNKVLLILKKRGIKAKNLNSSVELTNIKDKKNGNFEIDILGYDKEHIFIIECKSFHPHPFYMLKEDRERRKVNVRRFEEQFSNKIKPWLINKLNRKASNGSIKIQCYREDIQTNKGKSFQFSLPEKFINISSKKVIGLYITQLNEIFPDINTVYQLYYKDLETI